MKVVFCTPIVKHPHDCWVESLEATLPVIEAAGWEHGLAQTLDNPYISGARSDMLWKALQAAADVVVFIDYDIGWRPEDMLKLLEAEGDVVAGTYRNKFDTVEYMGALNRESDGELVMREDGCIAASLVPGGFLKISRQAVRLFMKAYPELCYGDPLAPHVDLFNHGARKGQWWGEDYAFSDRWVDCGGQIWVVPDMDIDHQEYKGNLHKYLLNISRLRNEETENDQGQKQR